MKYMTSEELVKVSGGASLLTGTFLNAVTKMFSTFFEVGRAIGSSIVRYFTGNYCV